MLAAQQIAAIENAGISNALVIKISRARIGFISDILSCSVFMGVYLQPSQIVARMASLTDAFTVLTRITS